MKGHAGQKWISGALIEGSDPKSWKVKGLNSTLVKQAESNSSEFKHKQTISRLQGESCIPTVKHGESISAAGKGRLVRSDNYRETSGLTTTSSSLLIVQLHLYLNIDSILSYFFVLV